MIRQSNFAGNFDTLPGNIKEGHRLQCDMSEAKTIGILFPPNAEGGDDSRAGYDNSPGFAGVMTCWKQHWVPIL